MSDKPDLKSSRTFIVLVCPICGATSSDCNSRYEAGTLWSAAGRCHLGEHASDPVLYVPRSAKGAA